MKEFVHLPAGLLLFIDPGSRLFWPNLLITFVIGLLFVWFLFSKRQGQEFFTWRYWWHPSSRVDYQVFIINAFLKVLLFGPLVALNYTFAKWTFIFLGRSYGGFGSSTGSGWLFGMITLGAFVFDDFLRFFHHYLMHKVPFLWSLHKTHHSAETLNPMTLFRIHPLESAMATVRNALSAGVIAGFLMYFFSGQVELWTLLGVNAFGFLFNSLFGNLRHSPLPIHFGFLERIFISPKQHQIHHSTYVSHFDKNFGVALSVWDQLFGTWKDSRPEKISSFGLEDLDSGNLSRQYFRIPIAIARIWHKKRKAFDLPLQMKLKV